MRHWRRCPDPFEAVTARLREWFEAEPWRTSRELLERLRADGKRVVLASSAKADEL